MCPLLLCRRKAVVAADVKPAGVIQAFAMLHFQKSRDAMRTRDDLVALLVQRLAEFG
jgi:hypothetical protein